jgi:dolichyl-phosphate beta-glucosyltransferase
MSTGNNNILLSVVIPAYNEEKRIGSTLKKIIEFFNAKKSNYEIIVVDDGSKDNTVNIIKDIFRNEIKIIANKKNKGKGYSVRSGFLSANGKYLLFSDADLSTPIEEADKLSKALRGDFQVIIGSRALKDSDVLVHQPIYRELMGKIFNVFVKLICLGGIKDTQCGFKLFTARAGKEICKLQRLDRFSFDVEMLFIAKKKGYKISEVPIRWSNDPETKVGAIKDSINMFKDLLIIRWNNFRGFYN